MHNLKIKTHRGLCSVFYKNFDESLSDISNLKPDIAIIDSKLKFLYSSQLKKLSFVRKKIFIESGENIKTLPGVFELLKSIENTEIMPINHVLVMGGATIQDVAGTALALLKRGTSWTYVPTTLLSQTDSCIGSKTSINGISSKNMYGLFFSPKNIYIMFDFIKSLPEIEILSGIGDAFHYLLLDVNQTYEYAIKILRTLSNNGLKKFVEVPENIYKLSSKIHKIKKEFIEKDEFDQRERKVLNLGHSFGHAIEAFFNYEVPHGVGVLIGLIMAIDISIKLFENKNDLTFINSLKKLKFEINLLLKKSYSTPIKSIFNEISNDYEIFLNYLSKDKKNTQKNKFNLVLFKNNTVSIESVYKEVMVKYLATEN